jgi:hypothetical protein
MVAISDISDILKRSMATFRANARPAPTQGIEGVWSAIGVKKEG